MKINGKEYLFAYTVGVKVASEERSLAKVGMNKRLVEMAILMNHAYEDRIKFENPNYECNYLNKEELLLCDAKIIPELDEEIAEVIKRDSNITVLTESVKKKELSQASR